MKTLEQKLKTFKRNARKLHQMWPYAYDAWKLARVSRGIYQCASCEGLFKRSDCENDHYDPVEPLSGKIEIFDWLLRLFSPTENYQILCKECHQEKSNIENEIRRANK